MRCIRSTGSTTPTGAAIIAAAAWFPEREVVVGARADRHPDGHLVDVDPEVLVVAAQTAGHPGEVSVVDRASDGLGRPAQIGEGDIQDLEPRARAAPSKQGRR